jgi:hypothetical protein
MEPLVRQSSLDELHVLGTSSETLDGTLSKSMKGSCQKQFLILHEQTGPPTLTIMMLASSIKPQEPKKKAENKKKERKQE